MSYFNKPSSPFFHQQTSVANVMRQVIYALVPGILVSTWILGWGVLIQCLIAITFAGIFEALILSIRKLPVKTFLFDGSAIVTALLFAITISPYSPWWVNMSGIFFAIVIAKHIYGGLGYNLFNPAMAGYIFVLLCFPVEMNIWPVIKSMADFDVGIIDTLTIIFTGQPLVTGIDNISGATPLGYMKSQLNTMSMISEIRSSPLFGSMGGKGWEWISFAWVAGGAWLFIKRIITWHLPVTFLASLFTFSLLFYWYDSDIYLSPLFTLLTGGTMLAAFFIVTDPVTASTTPRGRIYYAAGIGLLTYIIRTWGGYPDGIAFAVLIMNAAVPLIDTYTRQPVFGESVK